MNSSHTWPTIGTGRIGVLGVGRMGLPIVRALLAAGFEVTAFDPQPGRAAASGAAVATSAEAVAATVDVLVTVLPGSPEVRELMLGTDTTPGLIDTLSTNVLWLDLTSLDPALADTLAGAASRNNLVMVGAPMAGGVGAAETSTLTFFVGAASAAVERVRLLLEALGTIDHIGQQAADGYTAKLLANLLWFGQVVAVTEALLLGQARGIAPAVLRTTLAASAGGSVFINDYLDRLLDGDYAPSFGLDRCVEELNAVVALAETEGVPFGVSTAIAQLHRDALARFGAIDGEMLAARLLEERAGATIRR